MTTHGESGSMMVSSGQRQSAMVNESEVKAPLSDQGGLPSPPEIQITAT